MGGPIVECLDATPILIERRASQLPGFSDLPHGFTIDSYELDQDQWREGYITAS